MFAKLILLHKNTKIKLANNFRIQTFIIFRSAMICDGFIVRIYFIIFRKECPKILVTTKKMIAKVGHWYFEETITYIRVFGATGAPHLLPVHVLDHLILGEIRY
jgi:hypothetical protein